MSLMLPAAISTVGCGDAKRPKWFGRERNVPVVAPVETAEQPQPAPEKKNTPKSLEPKEKQSNTAPRRISKTDPKILAMAEAKRNRQVVSLTSRRPAHGKSGARAAGSTPRPLSEHVGMQDDLPGDDERPQPKLEPLPELDPLIDLGEGGPGPSGIQQDNMDDAIGRTAPATDTVLDPEPNVAPDADRKTPWDKKALKLADQNLAKIDAGDREAKFKPMPKARAIVMNREVIVAGATLQVNDQYITVDDILDGLHHVLIEIPPHVKGDAFQMQVAKILDQEIAYEIQQTLVYSEAKKYLEEEPKKQIDVEMEETLRDMIAKVGGSKEKLRQKCIREGSTLEGMLQTQRRSLTVRMYMRIKLMPAIIINRRMLWDYYRKNPKEFRTDKKVQMQIIAAPFKKFLAEKKDDRRPPTAEELAAAKSQAHKMIADSLRQLKNGAKFTDVARRGRGIRRSKGGTWPMMTVGNFREAKVEQQAFKLAQGKYSGIIEGELGYYIVKAKAVLPGKVVSFEQAQPDIADKLKRKQFGKLRTEYMIKVYDKATITRSLDFIKLAVERAEQKYRP
ncbi:MAG: peptidyl-prolyl cis-trans isomerase [Phycisphaerae bacterium]|nr:peptidyl-prolyl cis-trans isomerase [Phycisphaerae bacterium]